MNTYYVWQETSGKRKFVDTVKATNYENARRFAAYKNKLPEWQLVATLKPQPMAIPA